ncbi:Uncharacterized protein Fot_25024 [Forsythia ovata]|uniref:Uncharacterized protein n=1 Tax=Forsythia ovata TaxID=205694 RepID=A0ABD1U7U8_9LAMI
MHPKLTPIIPHNLKTTSNQTLLLLLSPTCATIIVTLNNTNSTSDSNANITVEPPGSVIEPSNHSFAHPLPSIVNSGAPPEREKSGVLVRASRSTLLSQHPTKAWVSWYQPKRPYGHKLPTKAVKIAH